MLIARRCTEVCTTSGSSPASRSCVPPRTASSRPFSVSATSTQPVNRFLAFHSLSPWRSRMSVWVMVTPRARRRGRLTRRATDEADAAEDGAEDSLGWAEELEDPLVSKPAK